MNTNDQRQLPEFQLLHGDASSAALVFYLKFFFTMWLIRYLFDPLQTLSNLPLEYAGPVGPLQWMPVAWYEAIHSFTGLMMLRAGIVVCAVGVWFGRTRMISAMIGCVVLTMIACVIRGFGGQINHAEIGPLLVTWVLTLFCFRLPQDKISVPTTQEHPTASVALITATMVLALVYAFVGIARLTNGGVELFLGDTIQRHVTRGSYSDWVLPQNFSNWVRDYPAIAWQLKIGTLLVTLVEIAAPFALISKRVRYVVLITMPLFHLGAILMFKVIFVEQMLSLILLINVSPWLAARARQNATKRSQKPAADPLVQTG